MFCCHIFYFIMFFPNIPNILEGSFGSFCDTYSRSWPIFNFCGGTDAMMSLSHMPSPHIAILLMIGPTRPRLVSHWWIRVSVRARYRCTWWRGATLTTINVLPLETASRTESSVRRVVEGEKTFIYCHQMFNEWWRKRRLFI